jgi:hypothetical protein
MGYLEKSDDTHTWIRNIGDVNFLFKLYFLRRLHTLQIVSIQDKEMRPARKLDLKQALTFGDSKLAFRVEVHAGSALVLLYFEDTWEWEEGVAYCQRIFPKLSSLVLSDEVGDLVCIESAEAWTYTKATARRMMADGFTPLLIFA